MFSDDNSDYYFIVNDQTLYFYISDEKEYVTVKFSTQVGIILGSVCVGALLVLLPVLTYACVMSKKQPKYYTTKHESRRYSPRTIDIGEPSSHEYKMWLTEICIHVV